MMDRIEEMIVKTRERNLASSQAIERNEADMWAELRKTKEGRRKLKEIVAIQFNSKAGTNKFLREWMDD